MIVNPMRHQRGFNLIELMIGLTISLMGLAAVASMMMTFSKTRNTLAQTQAAQDNGVMALYRLERDLGQAGYGMWNLRACTTITNPGQPDISPVPVRINFGGTGISDTITIQGTNPATGNPGTELSAVTAGGNTMTSTQFNVRSSLGFAVGDRVVTNALAPSCTLVTVNSVSASVTVSGRTTASIGYDTPTLSTTANPGFVAYFGNGGPAGEFFSRNYAVGLTGLTVGDYPAYTTSNLVDGIVFMKAQYGLSATATNPTVTRWVSGATVINAANVQLVKAIRIGVVARSARREDGEVDQPNPLPLFDEKPDASGLTDAVSYTIPDLKARYRAYSTIVPLKNAIWN